MSPQKNEDGSYNPSKMTMHMGYKDKTDYAHKKQTYEAYTGDKKVLVICTDEGKLKMENGKVFNTGNHPMELFGPLLYFRDAGFKFDFATTSGGAVVLEMFMYPKKDEDLHKLHDEYRSMMETPKKISDIANLDDYAAIFMPGGHGCTINLPSNKDLGNLLHIAHERKMPTVTLCHGPSTLLSTSAEGTGKEFAYDGYEIMMFTDKTDAAVPKFGYMPGNMPWKCQATIEGKGIKVINQKETGAVHHDRELLTGDGPEAGPNLGRLAAPHLLKFVKENNL